MKKIDRRKAIKNLTIGIGGASLLSSPFSGFATTENKANTIPFRNFGNPDIEQPVTVITLGAGGRGNVYGNYGIQFPKELNIVGVAEPISIRNERYAKKHNISEENRFDTWEHVFNRPKFEDEITANFSIEAFTSYHGRRTRIMGSHGDITGDMTEFTHTEFLTGKVTKWDVTIDEKKIAATKVVDMVVEIGA